MEDPTTFFSSIPLQTVVNLVYYVLLGIYAAFTAIIYYHWTTYATEGPVSRITLLTYMILTLPLLLLMGILLFII